MIYIRDLIKKKKNNEQLTEDEINFFIYSYNKDEILREQAASLLTLMNTMGITEKEMVFLSNAMAESGEKLNIYEISNQVVDIHPIGGMDDKIVIMILAILSALEMPSIKIIGREIGIKDKLLNAEIYKYNNENKQKIKDFVNNNKIVLIDEPEKVAPVENKLYKLRNDIACNDDISIIATNLMSQKIALGFRNIFFDISYGEKAYVKTLNQAQALAKYLIKIGNNINRNVKCIITKLDEPVGRFFGNTIELKEALEALKGNISSDVKELVLEIGSNIIELETGNKNSRENKQKILYAIESKKAYNKLLELISGGQEHIHLNKAKQIIPVMSTQEGYVEKIDISIIRTTAQYLNAIRHTNANKIDFGSGVEICKKIGDKVEIGELLGYIHTNDETKIETAVSKLKESFCMTNKKIKTKSRIIETL